MITSAYVVRGYFWDVLTSNPGLTPTLEGSEPRKAQTIHLWAGSENTKKGVKGRKKRGENWPVSRVTLRDKALQINRTQVYV